MTMTLGHVNSPVPPTSEVKSSKRFMSSIKRLNRVAPFKSSPSKTLATTSLQQDATGGASSQPESGDASFLYYKLGSSFAEQVLEKVYTGNAHTEHTVEEPCSSSPVYIDPVVIIKEKSAAQKEGSGINEVYYSRADMSV